MHVVSFGVEAGIWAWGRENQLAYLVKPRNKDLPCGEPGDCAIEDPSVTRKVAEENNRERGSGADRTRIRGSGEFEMH